MWYITQIKILKKEHTFVGRNKKGISYNQVTNCYVSNNLFFDDNGNV